MELEGEIKGIKIERGSSRTKTTEIHFDTQERTKEYIALFNIRLLSSKYSPTCLYIYIYILTFLLFTIIFTSSLVLLPVLFFSFLLPITFVSLYIVPSVVRIQIHCDYKAVIYIVTKSHSLLNWKIVDHEC